MWESLTPDIAEVDEKGRVTALQNGTAIIRAWAEDCETQAAAADDKDVETLAADDSFRYYTVLPQYTAEFKVSVNDPDNPIPPDDLKPEFVFGDADGDDMVTASDVAFILKKTLVSTFELPAEKNNK